MASVEELLAKYGKDDTAPRPDPYSNGEGGTSFNNEKAEESAGSTAISLNETDNHYSDYSFSNEDDTSEGVTNRDGRRLVSDNYFKENIPHVEGNEELPYATTPSFDSEFVFDEEDDDFTVETAIPTQYHGEQPSLSSDNDTQEDYVSHSEKHTDGDYTFELAEKAQVPVADTFDVDNYNNNFSNEDEYPEVYVASGSVSQNNPAQVPDSENLELDRRTETTPKNSYAGEDEAFISRLSELMPAPAETHAGLAAFSTFMFPPFGAVAVHHAMRTFTTAYNGEAEESTSHSSKALAWSIAAVIAGTLLLALIVAYKVNPAMFDTLFAKIGLLDNEH